MLLLKNWIAGYQNADQRQVNDRISARLMSFRPIRNEIPRW